MLAQVQEIQRKDVSKTVSISSESTTNNTDSELISKICNVVYRMLTPK